MKVTPLAIPGVKLLEPARVEDERGWFMEEFQDQRFQQLGLPARFRQENRSRSRQNVLRGLHYQLLRPQGKLVACTRGRIFDVAVDIRRGSPTFGKWVGVELHEDSALQLWIPEGFAHGFIALTPIADVAYRCTELYDRSDDRGVLWSDPDIGIRWPVSNPVLSNRDRALRPLRECTRDLPEHQPDGL